MSLATIKGPAIFLAQFLSEEPPFNSLESITHWASGIGYTGVQIPVWDDRLIDVALAAESKTYCDELKGLCIQNGVEITELASHLVGQLVATHPAHDSLLNAFAPQQTHSDEAKRREWAIARLGHIAAASKNMGLDRSVTFSGSFLWPFLYPHPAYPKDFISDAFGELVKRWQPILDIYSENGVYLCFEIHPMQDLHDGVTFERFLKLTDNHPACKIMFDPSHFVLQCIDYVSFIDHYHEHIKMFHVKDAEFQINGKTGVYGGYLDWVERAGRFRSLGDGTVDFKRVFSKLTQYGFDGWAVLEWECCLKNHLDGASEGSRFIRDHIIGASTKSFDDFVAAGNGKCNFDILGI
ncbi:MAG: sugar phosphate isomerase/epimerase family protein [Hoeflea sp.]|uniref:sugar phosphate isomerase/epimerase family protein n=1 Tax=Hoeflea sp. TaxID=1940281 RepID=UPI003297D26A